MNDVTTAAMPRAGGGYLAFRKPVTLAGEPLQGATFSEPTAGNWMALDGLSGAELDVQAVSIVAGIPPATVRDLGVRDFRRAVALVAEVVTSPAPVENDADTFTLTLAKPAELGEERVTELPMREPTAGEFEKWAGLSGTAADVRAVSTITGVREPLVQKIGLRDLQTAAGWLMRFFEDGPESGDPS